MLKKYNTLWVFGDSYTTPNFCVAPELSFWGLTASTLSIEYIKNYSWPGNSFDSIMHNVISLQDQYNYKDDLFLIGIPPLLRLTSVDKNTNKIYYSSGFKLPMWHHWTEEVTCHTGLNNVYISSDKQLSMLENRTWTVSQAMRNIFLLNSWLDSKNANYLVINLSKEFDKTDTASYNNFVLNYCIAHPKNILFENTYLSVNYNINKPADYNQYGWQGHHGESGNKYFFEKSVLPALEKNNLKDVNC